MLEEYEEWDQRVVSDGSVIRWSAARHMISVGKETVEHILS